MGGPNGTLVKTVPNAMPVERTREFFTFGLECLLAYFGVDESAVEFSSGNKELFVRGKTGELIFKVPLRDQQSIEINWFSNWKETQLREKLFTDIKNFYDGKDNASYIQSSQDLFKLMFNEFFDANKTQVDLHSAVELLRSFEMEEGDIQKIASFLEYKEDDNKEDFPEYSVVEKLLAKLDANMNLSPADLNGNFNPMCSMSDILRFSENKSSRLNEINDIEDKLIPQLINNKNKIRGLLYDYRAVNRDNLQEIEENLARNYENFQKFKLPAIQQLIVADEEKNGNYSVD